MRVLVLEDNEDRVRKFRRELVGNVVDFARDAAAALAFIGAHAYDLIFLDHDLGGEEMVDSGGANTGYRVASCLARDGKNVDARVAALVQPVGGRDDGARAAARRPRAVRVAGHRRRREVGGRGECTGG